MALAISSARARREALVKVREAVKEWEWIDFEAES
jgi:hypothetical protein